MTNPPRDDARASLTRAGIAVGADKGGISKVMSSEKCTAPDRIWAWPNDVEDGYMAASLPGNPPTEEYADGTHIEYVRAEKVERELAEAREALQRIEAASKFWSEYPDGNDAIRYAHESTYRLARAALGEGRE